MDKLHIVTSNEKMADEISFKLGLSAGRYHIITCMKDIEDLPDGIMVLNIEPHPFNSIEINTKLKEHKSIIINSIGDLYRLLDEWVNSLDSLNGMGRSLGSDNMTNMRLHVIDDLKNIGFNESYNFRYRFGWDNKSENYYVIPESDLSKLWNSLLVSYIRNTVAPSRVVKNEFKINDPKGVFKNGASIKVGF